MALQRQSRLRAQGDLLRPMQQEPLKDSVDSRILYGRPDRDSYSHTLYPGSHASEL